MATIEFIQKRIEGKLKEIAALDKKIARIEKAAASNWENNPYYYSERDLKSALRDKDIAEKALAKYQSDLQEANDKAASRNIPAITEFLDRWEQEAILYYLSEKDKFDKAYVEYSKKNSELVDKFNSSFEPEVRREAQLANRKLSKEFRETWTHVTQFNHGSKGWEQTMMDDIAKEKTRKHDDFIERIVPITGTIVDASNLRVNPKGDLDGWIEGDKGTAEVRTIGAAGYNIVRFHYRTLVRKIN